MIHGTRPSGSGDRVAADFERRSRGHAADHRCSGGLVPPRRSARDRLRTTSAQGPGRFRRLVVPDHTLGQSGRWPRWRARAPTPIDSPSMPCVAPPPDRSGAGRLSRAGVPGEVAATGQARGTGGARAPCPARTSGLLVILAVPGAAEGAVAAAVALVAVRLEPDRAVLVSQAGVTGGKTAWRAGRRCWRARPGAGVQAVPGVRRRTVVRRRRGLRRPGRRAAGRRGVRRRLRRARPVV